MKTLKHLPIFFILLLIGACSDDATVENTAVAKEIENTEFVKTALYNNVAFIKGKFKNLSTHDNEILLYTETSNKKHIFHVRTNEKFQIKDKITEVAYLNHGILLNKTTFIGVDGNVTSQLLNDASAYAKKNLQTTITANSLTHYSVSKDNEHYKDLTFHSPTLEKQVPAIVDTDGGKKCDHGGEGATSCSISSSHGDCSVSCGTGYYACCVKGSWSTEQSCHCEKG